MALKINFEAETGNDAINPLTVANAIIERNIFNEFELSELSDAIYKHVQTQKDKRYAEEQELRYEERRAALLGDAK